MVIGGHGEFILPVWSSVTVCGGKNSEPLKKLMDDYPEKLKLQGIKESSQLTVNNSLDNFFSDSMALSTREITLLKGYDNWAAGLAVGEIVESICSVSLLASSSASLDVRSFDGFRVCVTSCKFRHVQMENTN